MSNRDAKRLPLGIYRLQLKDGSWLLASVGHDNAGKPWFAPASWSAGARFDWKDIKEARLILTINESHMPLVDAMIWCVPCGKHHKPGWNGCVGASRKKEAGA